MAASELKLGGTYRHYKTKGLYQALSIVKNTENGRSDELMVLYFSFSANCLFVRPLSEFVANVTVPHGHTDKRDLIVKRFELVSS